jgi:hypothetical protein
MRIRTRRAAAVVTSSIVAWGLAAGIQPAHATYHLMMIREVFAGSAAQPNAHFVELQMHASGQNFVGGKQVKIFNAGGAEVGTFSFAGSVSNGANQASILVGTAEVQAAFGVAPDLTMAPVVSAVGGKACFFDPGDPYVPGSGLGNIDCVSWGAFAPGGDTGNPAAAMPQGMSIERRISGGTSSTTLDPGDDTNNSAADFQSAAPSPLKNSGAGPAPAPGTDTTAPATDIGKPVKGKTYNDSTFKRFRGTAADTGSALGLVEIALRQKLANGCKWWNGNRFVSGGCNNKKFKTASGLAQWTYQLSKKLKPSDEGNVRFYTLFARATDTAGNVESVFQNGRNANRFEIT